MAASASSAVSKVTKPNPLESRVWGSRMIWALVIWKGGDSGRGGSEKVSELRTTCCVRPHYDGKLKPMPGTNLAELAKDLLEIAVFGALGEACDVEVVAGVDVGTLALLSARLNTRGRVAAVAVYAVSAWLLPCARVVLSCEVSLTRTPRLSAPFWVRVFCRQRKRLGGVVRGGGVALWVG